MKYEVAVLLLLTGVVRGQEPQVLSLAGHIELPNVEGRIDHFSADVKGKRLFMSALGNNTVEVIDIDSRKRVRTVTGFAEPREPSSIPPPTAYSSPAPKMEPQKCSMPRIFSW